MRKTLTVIFPAKETAIKFIAGSQQRNSCKRVPLCASGLHSGERTVADRMRPRPHLSPENVVYSCPWPLALLTRGCESQRCTSGSIHKTDTRESAPFRLAFTPAPSQSPQRQGSSACHTCSALSACILPSGWKLIPVELCGSTAIHTSGPHTGGRRLCRWGLVADAVARLPVSGVPAPEPLGTYKQEGFLLEGSTPVPAELSQCVK